MTRSRAGIVIVAVSAATFALAGCGSTASTQNTSSNTSSHTSTGSQGPASASAGHLTRANFVSTISSAVADQKSAHVSVSSSMLKVDGDVSYAAKDSSMVMRTTINGQEGEIRVVDDVLYISMPGLTPKGKFVKLTKDNPTVGPMVAQLRDLGPRGNVEALSKGLKSVEYVGSTTIDGTTVAHYKVGVDTKSLLKNMGSAVPPEAKSKVPSSVGYDIYLDANNLMRRVVITLMGQRTVVNVSDWGKPVHVTAPPASAVVSSPKA